jgi:hypothetical protein
MVDYYIVKRKYELTKNKWIFDEHGKMARKQEWRKDWLSIITVQGIVYWKYFHLNLLASLSDSMRSSVSPFLTGPMTFLISWRFCPISSTLTYVIPPLEPFAWLKSVLVTGSAENFFDNSFCGSFSVHFKSCKKNIYFI